MKATADVIVTGKIDETAPIVHQIIGRLILIVESISRIPDAFETPTNMEPPFALEKAETA